jgi:hypothetical protein
MMRQSLTLRSVWVVLLLCSAATAADKSPARPDWSSLFPPPRPNYFIGFEPPVVAKGDNPDVYHVTVNYGWLGNDFRSATATLARDPEFMTKYAVETMKKEGAKEIMVGKKTAWVRPTKDGAKRECELIVSLSEDKALILASHGNFGGEEELTTLAGRFDLVQVEAALAKPPQKAEKRERP